MIIQFSEFLGGIILLDLFHTTILKIGTQLYF